MSFKANEKGKAAPIESEPSCPRHVHEPSCPRHVHAPEEPRCYATMWRLSAGSTTALKFTFWMLGPEQLKSQDGKDVEDEANPSVASEAAATDLSLMSERSPVVVLEQWNRLLLAQRLQAKTLKTWPLLQKQAALASWRCSQTPPRWGYISPHCPLGRLLGLQTSDYWTPGGLRQLY